MSSSVPVPKQATPARRIPRATCRLQFNRGFTFAQATAVLEYLRDLGISDCYASPLLQATASSTHGYDICDFNRLNPNLGSETGFGPFASRLRELGLGLLLDMVPNHMGTDFSNGWWRDVLENGRHSPFASYFDIDWDSPQPGLAGKVLLPVLGDNYARVLERGELRLVCENNALLVAYHDKRFPISPASAAKVRDEAPGNLSLALEQFNGRPGDPRSFDRLDELLGQQHYRLAYWRVGCEAINYRRFFDVMDLICIRVELPQVFEDSHRLVFKWIGEGKITGLRIDHPDGLWDPRTYFKRLQERASKLPGRKSLYIVSEKILSDDESLPADWPVDGTTGYDFLNQVNGLFVDGAMERTFSDVYRQFTRVAEDYRTILWQSKRKILETSLVSELRALALRLQRVASASRHGQDFTLEQLRSALMDLIAAFPVYRTYVGEHSAEPSQDDRMRIEQAIREVKTRSCEMGDALLDFVGKLLLMQFPEDFSAEARQQALTFVMRFQQLTGPVMAKGLEDTAFYRFNGLVALNEVGGNAGKFGASVPEFHAANLKRAERWPHSMLATATHDTKRGEDVRARINVLSELPNEWRDAVLNWREMNADKKSPVVGRPAPTANDEYLLYQSLVGAWPFDAEEPDAFRIFRGRVTTFMLKAVKEAKVNTSWLEPVPAYEDAVQKFVEGILANGADNRFLNDLKIFQSKVAFFGVLNSLSQTLLKIASPGVPDFYQGTELWDLSFVDPDNRRPVDYELRKKLLAELKRRIAGKDADLLMTAADLLANYAVGQIKMFVIWRALELRRRHATLFENGGYVPLSVSGTRREHVCAFARVSGNEAVVAVAPRLVCGLTGGLKQLPTGPEIWANTILQLPQSVAGDSFRNAFTGKVVESVNSAEGRILKMSDVFQNFPLALLELVTP